MAAKKTAVKQVQEILEDEVIVEEVIVEEVVVKADGPDVPVDIIFPPEGVTLDRISHLLGRRGFMRNYGIIAALYEYLESRGYSLDFTGELDEKFALAVTNLIGWDKTDKLYSRNTADEVWLAFLATLER